MLKRTLFIGDIHGCFDEFIKLLNKVNYDPQNDNLYLTGDLINKGPKVYELMDFLVNNPQIKPVIGNNEVNFIRFLANKLSWDFILDLGKDLDNFNYLLTKGLIDKTYDKESVIFDNYLNFFSKEYIKYILNLPLYIETNTWILLHGGLIPGKKIEEHHIDEITRVREYNGKPWYDYYKGFKTIIYGHWAADGLRIKPKTKGLDSGCVYGKRLSAYIINAGEVKDNLICGEIYQISALKDYVSI